MDGLIPVRIANYNIYLGTKKLEGLAEETKMPNMETISETLSGAGIMGELDVGNPGHFGSLAVEFSFRTLDSQSFELLKNSDEAVILRGATQYMNRETGKLEHYGVVVTLKGPRKGLDLGSFAVGKGTGTKVTVDAWYIKVEVNGEVYTELDKINFKYILNGEDMLANITPFM